MEAKKHSMASDFFGFRRLFQSHEPSELMLLLVCFHGFANGHVEMSNNISERAIKPFAIDRKNFLFAFSRDGTESSAAYFTPQQTARANGLDPERHVAKRLELCAGRNPKGDYSDLLPWGLCKRCDLK